MAGKIKKSNEEIGETFMEALVFAYSDNHENGVEKVAEFEEMFQGFVKYNECIPEYELAKDESGVLSCVYFAENICARSGKSTGKRPV